jgi:ethylbenzene dioxygenase beta subunit
MAAPATDVTAIEREIEKALYRYARTLDEQRYHDWLDLFTDDAVYSVMNYENQQDQGLYLIKDGGKEALKERAAYALGFWQAPRGKTLHTVSNIEVTEATSDEARVRSCLVVFRTDADGETQLHCCGSAEDVLVRDGGRWLFKQRAVVVDNGVLPPAFTEIL